MHIGGAVKTLCDASPEIVMAHQVLCMAKSGWRAAEVAKTLRLLICATFSVLAKYMFSATRPECAEKASCHASLEASAAGREQARIEGLHIPLQYLFCRREKLLLVGIEDLKRRHMPTSGFPSSHSVLFGYLLSASLKEREEKRGWFPYVIYLLIPLSRIYYCKHYTYQVVFGVLLGAGLCCFLSFFEKHVPSPRLARDCWVRPGWRHVVCFLLQVVSGFRKAPKYK